VEVAVEHVGGRVFEQAAAALARNGRLVTCGATTGSEARLDLNQLFGRHLSLMGSWMGRRAEMIEVLRFVRDGRLKPVLDSGVPLAKAARRARAHRGARALRQDRAGAMIRPRVRLERKHEPLGPDVEIPPPRAPRLDRARAG
jgi:NADPH:quinone reductase-like Zn-dependent oxidoreductase